MTETMECPKCHHKQPRDMEHPRTFVCSKCSERFIYRVGITGWRKQAKSRRALLPDSMRKKGIGVRETPATLELIKQRGYGNNDVWKAGIDALDIK